MMGASGSVLFTVYGCSSQVKEDKVDGTCGTHGEEKCVHLHVGETRMCFVWI
jgi:hypothetical protein